MKTKDFLVEYEGIGDDAHAMHLENEIQNARANCYQAAKCAITLHKLLADVSHEEGLEPWISEKLTLAADYLKTINEYLETSDIDDEEFQLIEPDFESEFGQHFPDEMPAAPGPVGMSDAMNMMPGVLHEEQLNEQESWKALTLAFFHKGRKYQAKDPALQPQVDDFYNRLCQLDKSKVPGVRGNWDKVTKIGGVELKENEELYATMTPQEVVNDLGRRMMEVNEIFANAQADGDKMVMQAARQKLMQLAAQRRMYQQKAAQASKTAPGSIAGMTAKTLPKVYEEDSGWHKKPKQHKDEFGNVIKDKNVAKHLAKKGRAEAEKKAKKKDLKEFSMEFAYDPDAEGDERESKLNKVIDGVMKQAKTKLPIKQVGHKSNLPPDKFDFYYAGDPAHGKEMYNKIHNDFGKKGIHEEPELDERADTFSPDSDFVPQNRNTRQAAPSRPSPAPVKPKADPNDLDFTEDSVGAGPRFMDATNADNLILNMCDFVDEKDPDWFDNWVDAMGSNDELIMKARQLGFNKLHESKKKVKEGWGAYAQKREADRANAAWKELFDKYPEHADRLKNLRAKNWSAKSAEEKICGTYKDQRAGWMKKGVSEDASAGASSAGSVAAVVSPLGDRKKPMMQKRVKEEVKEPQKAQQPQQKQAAPQQAKQPEQKSAQPQQKQAAPQQAKQQQAKQPDQQGSTSGNAEQYNTKKVKDSTAAPGVPVVSNKFNNSIKSASVKTSVGTGVYSSNKETTAKKGTE